MPRAFLIVMDSVGCGGAPDAADFGDTGANTLLHIAQACAEGRADDGRQGPLHLPTLSALGLDKSVELACGQAMPGPDSPVTGAWGAATEISPGKDTPSGHWELAGVPVPWDWHYFPDEQPCFPTDLAAAAAQAAGSAGILANCHGSGTVLIDQFAAEHIETGWPICYTSADSVFQIAAHETHFGLQKLYDMCEALAPDLHAMKVGRVIARPFVGDAKQGYQRTSNRRDYAVAPPQPTLCDWVQGAGQKVYAVGKIGDIFSHRGIDDLRKGTDDILMGHLSDLVDQAEDGALVFANFVEFDSLYGHRRDVAGYARALEWFDASFAALLPRFRPDDLVILTADHGNDPTWHGTDHTRERVPVLAHGLGARALGQLGFADVAATVAAHLGVTASGPGRSFL